MIALTLAEIAGVTGGAVRNADPGVTVTASAAVDSRAVEPGALFVAVEGERADGHDFAAQALDSGAVAALVSHDVGVACVVVDDTVLGLGRVAAEVRSRLTDCTVIGVTGSQGKTGAKDMLGELLEPLGEAIATPGNMNNEIGVPLTVTQASERTRFLVVELGARQVGNISYLCEIAAPAVGLVLNVGVAHLGEFGSRENIAVAKGELVQALPDSGEAVLNADDGLVAAMAGRTGARVVTFGTHTDATVRIRDLVVDGSGEPHFYLEHGTERAHVHLPLLGEHQAYNATAAAAVARSLGVELDDIADTLGNAQSRSAWRMERHRRADGAVVVNDAYNANPDSMRAALTTLASMAVRDGARTIAVLGEMLELGDSSWAEHETVGRLAGDLGIDRLVVVGTGAAGIHDGAAGRSTQSVRVADADAATAWAREQVRPGDVVLVKASRASGLEAVASAVSQAAGHNASGTRSGDEGNDTR